MLNSSLKISNYKCFGEEPCGFDKIARINLIIGRNNSGKSALLDIIELATKESNQFEESVKHKKISPKLILQTPLSEQAIKVVFPSGRFGGGIQERDHWEYGKHFVDCKISVVLTSKKDSRFLDIEEPSGVVSLSEIQGGDSFKQALAQHVSNPFQGKIFQRVFAERNIIPEDKFNHTDIDGYGVGVTNEIQNIINSIKFDRSWVESDFLYALNRICFPDSVFQRVVCQIHDREENGTKWEIFLEEKTKGRIALSKTGSGLKTIIIVLSFILLLPKTKNKSLSDYIFAFEELENNLHPSLLRRLLSYLTAKAKEENFLLFLTTHSNVMIDVLNQDKEAQIIHVTHDSEKATARPVKTYIETNGILDDLDVRASDLLQANGIIWVEGPSDRIYLSKWIELYSEGKLSEGLHYQIVFYGGRLLAHLSDTPDEESNGIQLFQVNRNNALLIDSDKKSAEDKLNATKERIIKEVKNCGGICWVTEGREIENYIPLSSLQNVFPEIGDAEPPGQYDSVFEWLDEKIPGKGKSFGRKKPFYAEKIVSCLEKNDLAGCYDLEERIQKVVGEIRKWNNIPEPKVGQSSEEGGN